MDERILFKVLDVVVIAPEAIAPDIDIALARFKVTDPEVPPPVKLVPATTAVISPSPPPPTAAPLKYKAPPTL